MNTGQNEISFVDCGPVEIVRGRCVHTFPLHVHQSECVGVVVQGMAEFTLGKKKTILRQGDNYVIPQMAPHTLSSVDAKGFSYIIICSKGWQLQQGELEPFFKKATGMIADLVTQPFSVRGLAAKLHLTESHFVRKFKKQVGITPYQYYLQEKIKNACRGLRENISTADLAFALRFSDQSHLCNTFKKFVGISPQQYRGTYRRV